MPAASEAPHDLAGHGEVLPPLAAKLWDDEVQPSQQIGPMFSRRRSGASGGGGGDVIRQSGKVDAGDDAPHSVQVMHSG